MVYPSLFSKHGAMCDGKVHCFEDGNGEQKKPEIPVIRMDYW